MSTLLAWRSLQPYCPAKARSVVTAPGSRTRPTTGLMCRPRWPDSRSKSPDLAAWDRAEVPALVCPFHPAAHTGRGNPLTGRVRNCGHQPVGFRPSPRSGERPKKLPAVARRNASRSPTGAKGTEYAPGANRPGSPGQGPPVIHTGGRKGQSYSRPTTKPMPGGTRDLILVWSR